MLVLLGAVAWGADESATWSLSVDGAPVGTRSIAVRYEGQTGDRTRIVEVYTDVRGGVKKKDRWSYQQRLTATSREGDPASFASVIDANGAPREIQARFADGVWHVSVSEPSGTRTYELRPTRVDLSTIDLLDPEANRRIAGLDQARILSAEIGKILEGPVTALGPSQVTVGAETLEVEGWEWQTDLGAWRFWYAADGFLLKYEQPLLDRVVTAELSGEAPRTVDEFAVPAGPAVEAEDL